MTTPNPMTVSQAGSLGGTTRMSRLTPAERSELARKAGLASKGCQKPTLRGPRNKPAPPLDKANR